MRNTRAERQGWIYRAVVREVTTYTDGREPRVCDYAYGPYDTKAPATRAKTSETYSRTWRDGTTVVRTGRVEMSAVIWIPAE